MSALDSELLDDICRRQVGQIVDLSGIAGWSDDDQVTVKVLVGRWRVDRFMGAAEGYLGRTAHFEVVPEPDVVPAAGERRAIPARVLLERIGAQV